MNSLLPLINWNRITWALIPAAFLVGIQPLRALDFTWDPDLTAGIQAGSGTWDLSQLNWTTDSGATHAAWTNASPTNSATFAGVDGTYTINLSGINRTDGITFSASGYTLQAASAVTITNAGTGLISVASGKSATVGNNVTITRASSHSVAGGGTLFVNSGGTIRATANGLTIADNSTVILNGGTASVTANINFVIGNSTSGSGTLTINSGGTAIAGANAGNFGLRYSGHGTVNLDGGLLQTGRIYSNASPFTQVFNFNGGQLQVIGASGTDFMVGLTSANVKEGGAKIDTNGFDIAVGQALEHGGVTAEDGGLVKSGNGAMILGGINTYTGDTVINAGTLQLADNAGLKFVIGASGVNNGISGTGTLVLGGDFTFDLTDAAAVGSWEIVNIGTLSETFNSSFTVNGFAETVLDSGIWQFGGYTFTESTGFLTAVPEPSSFGLLAVSLAALLVRRQRK